MIERAMLGREWGIWERWARNAEARQCGDEFARKWLDWRVIHRLYIDLTSAGSSDRTWFDYVARKIFSERVEKALNLGYGGRMLEPLTLSFSVCLSYDVSRNSIKTAWKKARKAGLLDQSNYVAADFNSLTLEENGTDARLALADERWPLFPGGTRWADEGSVYCQIRRRPYRQ